MPTPLKDYVSLSYVYRICPIIEEVATDFDKKEFRKLIFDNDWENKELKQRTHHIAAILKQFLDSHYCIASKQLIGIAKGLESVEHKNENIGNLFLADFIEDYGVGDFKNSVTAIEQVTKLVSCEFAVRPFYNAYPEKMMKQTLLWAKNEDYRIRRLASEGCRAKLPWTSAVPFLTENPLEVMKVLEILVDDSNAWVRLSVSNNLNDISKENPELVLDFASKWIGKSPEIDKLLKHALRTLLKKGDKRALKFFGYKKADNVEVLNLKLSKDIVKIGAELEFSFELKNKGKNTEKIRLEYIVYYQKAKGSLNPKIYKISELELKPSETVKIDRKRSFKIITTRKFYTGLHKISIVVNGNETLVKDFNLVD